ncbi:hypothetical protein Acr_00g0067750 [Actinidia rufa]|uniref:Uncharacterized protein n=1 Tax=Actinidia rufa TaxID=165716 RepID=A0A7J0DS93_9ERIC|nr:hypothetical protein Acr_00g0067750 [Actinidia rufa]
MDGYDEILAKEDKDEFASENAELAYGADLRGEHWRTPCIFQYSGPLNEALQATASALSSRFAKHQQYPMKKRVVLRRQELQRTIPSGTTPIGNALKELVRAHHPSIAFLMETMNTSSTMEKIRSLKLDHSCYVDPIGLSGGLALWWKDNEFGDASEKEGSNNDKQYQIMAFQNMLNDCGLIDLETKGQRRLEGGGVRVKFLLVRKEEKGCKVILKEWHWRKFSKAQAKIDELISAIVGTRGNVLASEIQGKVATAWGSKHEILFILLLSNGDGNQIIRLKDENGVWQNDMEAIAQITSDYFAKLFDAPIQQDLDVVLKAVSPRIIEEMNTSTRWNVADGDSISFWDDKWVPSFENFEITSQGPDGSALSKVSDFIFQGCGHWHLLLLRSQVTEEEVQAIATIPISSSNSKDQLVWHFNANGIYSVKSGYSIAFTQYTTSKPIKAESSRPAPEIVWKKIWSTPSPPKVKHFIRKLDQRSLVWAWTHLQSVLGYWKARNEFVFNSNVPDPRSIILQAKAARMSIGRSRPWWRHFGMGKEYGVEFFVVTNDMVIKFRKASVVLLSVKSPFGGLSLSSINKMKLFHHRHHQFLSLQPRSLSKSMPAAMALSPPPFTPHPNSPSSLHLSASPVVLTRTNTPLHLRHSRLVCNMNGSGHLSL